MNNFFKHLKRKMAVSPGYFLAKHTDRYMKASHWKENTYNKTSNQWKKTFAAMTGYFPTMLYTFGFTAYKTNKSLVKEKRKVTHIYEFMSAFSSACTWKCLWCHSWVFMFCILLLLIGKTYRCKIGMNDAADMTYIIIVHLRTSPERSSYWKKTPGFCKCCWNQ